MKLVNTQGGCEMATKTSGFMTQVSAITAWFHAQRMGDRAYYAGVRPQKFQVEGADGTKVNYALVSCLRRAGRNGMDWRESLTVVREGKKIANAVLDRRDYHGDASHQERAAFSQERSAVWTEINRLIAEKERRDTEFFEMPDAEKLERFGPALV
jgi:hypothetical protein